MAATAILSLIGVCSNSFGDAPATQPTAEQFQKLQERVAELEAKQSAIPVTQPTTQSGAFPITFKTNTSNVGAGVNDVVSGISGGWDGTRFTLASQDGNFTLHPGIVLEIRDMLSYRVDVPKAGAGEVAALGYDTQNGFDLSRFRLIFDGTLFHQAGYFVQISDDQGQGFALLDAVASYRFGTSPFSVKAGQFKDPVWHERNLSEADQMTVDRSLLEYFLGGGQGSRVQGVAVTYDQDRVRAQVVAHDGFNSQNTKFFDAGGDGAGVGGESGVTPTDFGFSGRAEYMLIGDRTQQFNPYNEYEQFSALHAKQDILVVGAGADYSQAGDNYLMAHSADIQYDAVCGFSAYAAYFGTYRDLHTNQGIAPGSYYDSGFEVQAAYVINQHFEPFIRYEWMHLDNISLVKKSLLNSDLIQALTLGANYYIYGQNLKLTVDGSWLPNGSPADADALGVLRDSGKYEFVLRTQLQLAL